MDVVLDVRSYGAPVDITPPDPSDVVSYSTLLAKVGVDGVSAAGAGSTA